MSDILEAIERVADKRHERTMQYGATEKEAAQSVCEYLKHLRYETHKDAKHLHTYIDELIKGYSA